MKSLFGILLKASSLLTGICVLSSATPAMAAVSFVLKDGSNKAVNVWLGSNAAYRFEGYPRAFVMPYNSSDPEQRFDALTGSRGGTLYRVQGTNLCLNNHYINNGSPINVWTCNANDPDQNWRLINLNGSTHIQNVTTNRCIDSPKRDMAPNNLHVWDCMSGSRNQQFNVIGNVTPPPPPPGNIDLPFAKGSPWYVCQGYKGTISHQGYYALDLSVDKAFGNNNSCWGNVNSSTGRQVLAPADGTIHWIDGDTVCLSLDSNRGIVLAHITAKVPVKQKVVRGSVLGTVNAAGIGRNGGFSHIHIEGRNGTCQAGTSKAFTNANGLQFTGIGDLSGDQTHWKRELSW
jgi:hypothetical protein